MQDDGFVGMFDQHAESLLAYALRRLPTRHEAEDAVAETFAIAWRRREAMPAEALPWLYGVAARVISNQRRSARRLERLRFKLAGEGRESPTDHVELLGERDAFACAFAGLSGSQMEILRLVAWEGLDTREGAAALGCSQVAFKVRLHRARRELEKRMAHAGHVGEVTARPGRRSGIESP